MCLHPSQRARDEADVDDHGATPGAVEIPRRRGRLARLRRVRDRIDREHAQPLDVEALARGAHMSAGLLSREFRCAYGQSPYAYLMALRIARATALLHRGNLSVTDVCTAVGCSSVDVFSTRFTELVGVPPGVYRCHQATRATRIAVASDAGPYTDPHGFAGETASAGPARPDAPAGRDRETRIR